MAGYLWVSGRVGFFPLRGRGTIRTALARYRRNWYPLAGAEFAGEQLQDSRAGAELIPPRRAYTEAAW